ncbi:Guanylate cyclase [Aphelenchoides fujianensis]|nr:Guanylate cyclase [Aphelenchoides fujianensis]
MARCICELSELLYRPREKRNLMHAALLNGMTSADYVYIFIQTNAEGFGNPPFWQAGDEMDAPLKEAAKTVLILDKFINDSDTALSVRQEIADAIRGWPFYFTNVSSSANASNLAVYLGDSMMTYLIGLNQTYKKSGTTQLKNGTAVLEDLRKGAYEFPSIFGNTFSFSNSIRAARYSLSGLDAANVPSVWAVIASNLQAAATAFNTTYKVASTSIWATRNGQQPLSTPVCGFSNEKCVGSPIVYTAISIGGVIFFALVLLGLFAAIWFFQTQQRRRLNALWQVPYILLDKPKENSFVHSSRSMQSGNSNSNKSAAIRKATDRTEFLFLNNEIVVAIKQPFLGKWTAADEEEFRRMRQLDHVNLNRFIGLSIAENTIFFLWAYCERGSIMEVIDAHSFRIDSYIMCGMIKDVAEGLSFIHNSPFQQHGLLTPHCCMVSDRFQVKIQCYGVSRLKQHTQRSTEHPSALFVAPEHLQGKENNVGSKQGDVFSFAIVCSVILTMRPAYGIENIDEVDEGECSKVWMQVVRKVVRGDHPPTRPALDVDPSLDIQPELISLIKRCWAEMPAERPSIDECRAILVERILQNKNLNIMDHMFALMENNAAELEQDVAMRRMELLEEKKRADVLLNRMMPPSAAEALKLGQSVAPEVFGAATVFFSDIVSFTVLASKSSPLQIINFLNSVYTLADNVIDSHDAYKAGILRVETIGDGMHVVSGVPKRNGNAHAKAVAEMSIDFQRAVRTLRLPHLPDHPIQMRALVLRESSE